MNEYYGINRRKRQELYGPPPPPPPPPSGNGGNNPTDVEQGGGGGGVATNDNNILDSNIYHHAASSNNAGRYNTHNNTPAVATAVVDDYSFSDVKISSSPGNNNAAGAAAGIDCMNGTNPTSSGRSANVRDNIAARWFGGLFGGKVSADYSRDYLHPDMSGQTNFAPRASSSQYGPSFMEWYPGHPSKEGAFANYGDWGFSHPAHQGPTKRRRFAPAQKCGMWVVGVALVCIVFGVTVSELKKQNARYMPDDGGSSEANDLVMLAPPAPDTPSPTVETLEPTLTPTLRPTPNPTPLPTKKPVTSPPTAQGDIPGYAGIHEKAFDGTSRPSRAPITAGPSDAPTYHPTELPTWVPSVAPTKSPMIEIEQVNPNFPPVCEDEPGLHMDYLLTPKDCLWLDNMGELGYTDRKDKNCGGIPTDPITGKRTVYPPTELGRKCPKTCGLLYKGCRPFDPDSVSVLNPVNPNPVNPVGPGIGDYLQPTPDGGQGVMAPMTNPLCVDKPGRFENHLGTPKDCNWLHNDKEGKTDRKDKNCDPHNVSELGEMCLHTCRDYNFNCGEVVGILTRADGQAMRSFSSPNYSYSLEAFSSTNSTSPSTSFTTDDDCVDGEGTYTDHHDEFHHCSWLNELVDDHGNAPPEGLPTHRKNKNCGSPGSVVTELGFACPQSCSEYNWCGL